MSNVAVELAVIVGVTLLTVLVSLSGGILMLSKSKLAKVFEKVSLPFAIAVLLYAVFFDVLPEALEGSLPGWAVAVLMLGGAAFCGAIRLFAEHYHKHDDAKALAGKPQATAMLIVDSLHTAADGVVLGLAFAASLGTGALTALATAAHEVPQEMGDFAIMQRSKIAKKTIIKMEVLSGLILVPMTVLAYFVGDALERYMPVVLSLIAGNLLYIAWFEIIALYKQLKPSRARKGENNDY